MGTRELFNEPWSLDEGDTGEPLLAAPLVHNHDLDPTCTEYRIQGRLLGACIVEEVAHPCGHITRMPDCGGCDPSAVEFVRDDSDGVWRKVAAHADRDKSEEPPRPAPREWLPDGNGPVWGDVRHHRQRIDQLNEWVKFWYARAAKAERALADERAKVGEVVGRWESDRDTCLAWIADPTMHVDEDHPTRLSDKADMLNRHAQEIRAAAALAGPEPEATEP